MHRGGDEREIKLPWPSEAAMTSALRGMGARAGSMAFEDNTLLDDKDRSLSARGCALRVRVEDGGPRALLTWKGPARIESGAKVREEIETSVELGTALSTILVRAGFAPSFRYQKRRTPWSCEGFDLALAADVSALGCFLELEGPQPDIERAVAALGRTMTDAVTASYPSLWRARGEAGDMLLDVERESGGAVAPGGSVA